MLSRLALIAVVSLCWIDAAPACDPVVPVNAFAFTQPSYNFATVNYGFAQPTNAVFLQSNFGYNRAVFVPSHNVAFVNPSVSVRFVGGRTIIVR